MTEKIVDGDYVKNSDKTELVTVEYIEELLQNVRLILTAQRGRFYPNKDFGSYIGNICSRPENEYAVAFARQALDSIDGVFVKNAEINGKAIVFDLIINNEERQVMVNFENNL